MVVANLAGTSGRRSCSSTGLGADPQQREYFEPKERRNSGDSYWFAFWAFRQLWTPEGLTGRVSIVNATSTHSASTTLVKLRRKLDGAFSRDTAAAGTVLSVPSAGHCAAVAAVVHAELGGQFVSTTIGGRSHWFNRLEDGGLLVDVDLTGDQFGYPRVRIAPVGELYPSSRVRTAQQLDVETLRRALLLAVRSGLSGAEHQLSQELRDRSEVAADC